MPKQHRDSSGEFVKIAYAQDRARAEMIQGLLENAGIPSILQGLGVDGPHLGFGVLVNNPQRVMVRADQAEHAHALLAEVLPEDQQEAWKETVDTNYPEHIDGKGLRDYGLVGAYARSYLWAIGAFAVAFGIFLLLRMG